MKIKSKQDYVESLRQQPLNIYFMGEKVPDRSTFPAFLPHINCAAKTYEMALAPEYEELLTAKSHLTGNKINRFTHIHQSVDDLIKKVQMLRALAHETASCFQRCVGFDALNALYMTTYEIDEKYGTEYFKRLEKYLAKIQEENFEAGAGHWRRHPGNASGGQGSAQPGDRQVRREVPEGHRRCLHRDPHESLATAGEHDRRHRVDREHARRGLSTEPKDHVSKARQIRRKDEDGQEDCQNHRVA
jgi:hypothetical protein